MAFGAPGRNSPIYIATLGDKYGQAKGKLTKTLFGLSALGGLVRIDKKTMYLTNRRADEEVNTTGMGGYLAAQPRQNVMISTELGDPKWLFSTLLYGKSEINGHAGKHRMLRIIPSFLDSANGSKLNVWQIFPFRLRQTIHLNEFDASAMICIRFCHNTEVNHGFACSALGSSIFHLYKNSVRLYII